MEDGEGRKGERWREKKNKVWKNKKGENEAEKEKPQRGCVFLVFLLAFLFPSSRHRMKCIERKDFSYSNEAVFPLLLFFHSQFLWIRRVKEEWKLSSERRERERERTGNRS